jgi:outer membrane lipoprotein-sorting protein
VTMRRILLAIGALIVIAAGCDSAEPKRSPAEELMHQVVQTYRTLTAYQDEGVVLSYWADRPEPDEMHFETYFRKPADLRFEWIQRESQSVVWSNRRGTFSYWDGRPEKISNESSLGSAIQGSTGVSQGAITTIPGLIVGRDRVIWSVEDVHDLSLLEPAESEGIPCVRMRGILRGSRVEIWIGRDDFLIRRIVTTRPPDKLGRKLPRSEEIRRNLEFNHSIPDAAFEFTP